MKSIKSLFFSEARHAEPPAKPAAIDVLMLDVDFLDSQGRWNPKVVLFSKETARERSQSLLVKLFGGVMKFQARRWAVNYLDGILNSKSSYVERHRTAIEAFLNNIKTSGEVDRQKFYHLAALTMLGAESNTSASTPSDSTCTPPRARSAPAFLNRDSVIQHALNEMLGGRTEGKKYADIFGEIPAEVISQWITDHVKDAEEGKKLLQQPDLPDPEEGKKLLQQLDLSIVKPHQVILQIWQDFPVVRGTRYADSLYEAAYQSGFLNYCDRGLVNPTTETLDKLFKFLKNYQHDFPRFKITLSEPQYEELFRQAVQLAKDIDKERRRLAQQKNTPLFETKKVLTGDDMNDIFCNIEVLQNRLQPADIEKIS